MPPAARRRTEWIGFESRKLSGEAAIIEPF
jgi:hypothetical protein